LITRKYLRIPASFTTSKRFFFQGALIIIKLYNKLNKSTFNKISYLKNWGLFKEEEEENKKQEKNKENQVLKEDNQFIII
jgi:hypothetical protein